MLELVEMSARAALQVQLQRRRGAIVQARALPALNGDRSGRKTGRLVEALDKDIRSRSAKWTSRS